MKGFILVFVLVLIKITATAQLQKGAPMVGLNFVSNVPSLPFGMAFPVFFKNSRIGVYGDMKFNFTGEGVEGNDLTDTLSQYEIENYLKHPYLGQRKSSPFLFNLGVTIKSNKKELVFYAGAGALIIDTYRQYFDPSRSWSSTGKYYILENRIRKINVTGGAMYFFDNGIILQGGFDTTPFGLNLGIGFVFSRYSSIRK